VVLNARGQQVSSIEYTDLPAGKYTRKWDASGFPPVMYYYRLQACTGLETKKLVLLK
jgi:hypothetical protein